MAIVPGPPVPPNHHKNYQRYRKAYKRWVIALYNHEVLGKDEFAWVHVQEILPPSKKGFAYDWGEAKWITGKDWKENYESESRTSGRWCMGPVITEYDQAYFLLCGWARKVGQKIPPKYG